MLCCSANKSFFFNHTSVASLYTVALFFFYYDIWFCVSLVVILCINVFFLVCRTLINYPSCYWFCSWFSSSFYGSLSLHTTSYFLKSISWQLHDKYMYWRMQMKPYLLSYGIYFFIDGSLPCPSSHLIPSSMVVPVHNPTFVSSKQQDHLIMSVFLSSLSTELLHLVVDWHTSSSIWQNIEQALASPSNSCIIQLYESF